MTAEQLAGLAGLFLSLAFSYVPGLNEAYAKLNPTQKRLAMALLLLAVAAGALLYHCRAETACVAVQWDDYLSTLLAALVANQGAFLLSPRLPRPEPA